MDSGPRPDDPYRECATYLEHGACVCSTGYPATCTADNFGLGVVTFTDEEMASIQRAQLRTFESTPIGPSEPQDQIANVFSSGVPGLSPDDALAFGGYLAEGAPMADLLEENIRLNAKVVELARNTQEDQAEIRRHHRDFEAVRLVLDSADGISPEVASVVDEIRRIVG